jgi:hypothetical protein
MEFPTLVYRCPGNHQRPGGTYSYRQVTDGVGLAKALAEGWFATLPEAITGKLPEVVDEDNDAAPTREEMEAKATELQIKFDGRTSDKALRDRIAAALEE